MSIVPSLTQIRFVLQDLILRSTDNFTYHIWAIKLKSLQEYRRCVEKWKVAAVNTLFDTLHAMCNLLILPPENLRGAAQGDQLANLDRTILDNWIQLRTDYKPLKLGSYL